MSRGEWVLSRIGGRYDQTYIVDGVEVGYVEQEHERRGGITGPLVATGRYHWFAGPSRGGCASRAAAKRKVEERAR